MSDESIAARIENLVAEEHQLQQREASDRKDEAQLDADQERLQAVEVELDRCWDLLRQRRAREEFGQDPDETQVRDADTVHRYLRSAAESSKALQRRDPAGPNPHSLLTGAMLGQGMFVGAVDAQVGDCAVSPCAR